MSKPEDPAPKGPSATRQPPAAPQGTVAYVPRAPGGAPPAGTQVYVPRGAVAPRQGTQVLDPSALASDHHDAGLAPAAGAELGEPRAGDRVRQYELIRLLGRGGMGDVFLARDTKLGRRVAIKFLHTQDPALVERFVLEARATAGFNHENIVILYEADTVGGRPYMALEYLQGRTLADLLEDGQPLPPNRAVELLVPVLRALAAAHGQGIVHRDLKPENVFLTDAGVIKVLDFGIAKVLGGGQFAPESRAVDERARAAPEGPPAQGGQHGLTEHGSTLGTLAYMSPEQWSGGELDGRSDLWSVGVMLFRMLSGRHPLHGLEGMQLACVAELDRPMPTLQSARPDVPAKLAAVVDACLAKDRARRPPDALGLLRLLEPFLPGRIDRETTLEAGPYAGLVAFQEADADKFFGRTREIAALVTRIHDRPLVAVVGPSGVGKSSFVRAGVLPALKRSGEDWTSLVLRPGRTPLASLASVLATLGATTSPGSIAAEVRQEQDLRSRLLAEPGFAGAVLRAHARRQGRQVVLFVDQFEEIYTQVPDAAERLAFTACLAAVADDAAAPVRLLLSIRSDFLDRVSEDAAFMADLSQGLFFLTTPTDDGLREALTLPAELAGYRFETPQMVDQLLRDVRSTQGALSLLQFAASQLWEARDPARRLLTEASYQAIGGIAGALARYADRVLEELPPESQGAARNLFLRLVTPDRTRAIVPVEELSEPSLAGPGAERLVEQLVQARLLVLQKGGGSRTAELVHESLVHTWPTLRRWLDERGEDAHFLEQLRVGAAQWSARGRGSDLLWRGELADEARRFQRRLRRELPEQQQAFLAAVLANQDRIARRKRAFVVGVVTVLTIMVVGSLVALVIIRGAQQEAERQTGIARAAETTAKAAEAAAKTAEAAERQRAEELQVKEQERAEAARRAEAASAELLVKNGELEAALGTAEQARRRATVAQAESERSSREARQARERADLAARQLAVRLAEEQERVRRLQEQFGSPIAETLVR